jgi:transcriptional regulator with PAS, ATPase and Fis domain
MKNDMTDLKKLVAQIMESGSTGSDFEKEHEGIIKKLYNTGDDLPLHRDHLISTKPSTRAARDEEQIMDTEEIVEESLSLEEKEKELIRKALDKHNGKRKYAALDLGISERTLYRKIKEYNIE